MNDPKAYVFVEVEVTDMAAYRAEYMTRATAAVAAHNGRFIVRGDEATVIVGESHNRRRALLQFDSYERALEFYHSAQYQEAVVHRDRHSIAHRFVIMQGTRSADGLS